MHEKFMKIKRLVIPTITMVIIASQLMGCAAVSKSELLSMIDKGESIEIEIAEPVFAEQKQGEQLNELTWAELARLDTVKDLRKAWDNKLLISLTDTGKNGMLYVDITGENINNNTLRVALHNREFIKQLDDKVALKELADTVRSQYADIDDTDIDKKAVYIGINGYFNLLQDAIPNYSNADSTITRAEFMSMVMRAETPVDNELTERDEFANAVGTSEYNKYAQEVAGSSYLDIDSKSLNNQTYNGSMTRAEAVYLLMNRYFGSELSNVDVKGAALSDCKDGGSIADKQQFSGKDYAKSYELTYALQNPDKGVPTDIYKAIVLANQKGIMGNETRWDEAITKAEAIEMLVETLKQEKGIEQFAFKAGAYENEKENGENGSLANGSENESGENGSLASDGDNESLSTDGSGIDGAGIDAEIQEGEYSQADNGETDTKVNTIDPDSIPTNEIGAYLDSLTQDEISAMDPDVLTELIYWDLYGDESSSSSNHIQGNPVEGATPGTGDLGDYEFGQGGEVHEEAKGQLQH